MIVYLPAGNCGTVTWKFLPLMSSRKGRMACATRPAVGSSSPGSTSSGRCAKLPLTCTSKHDSHGGLKDGLASEATLRWANPRLTNPATATPTGATYNDPMGFFIGSAHPFAFNVNDNIFGRL